MDWRLQLRKLVNRDSDLSWWRLAALRVVDPVEWYMRRDDPRPFSRLQQGHSRVSYEPLADAPITRDLTRPAQMSSRASDQAHEIRRADVEPFATYFGEKAAQLLRGEEVVLDTTGGTVRARLVKFGNGAVINHETVSPRFRGRGRVRIERGQLADPIPVVSEYLVGWVVELGPGALPLP